MASGDLLAVLWAEDGIPPESSAATLGFTLVASTDEPDDLIPSLDFDNTAAEYMDWKGVMPNHYGSGGVNATVWWFSTTTGSNVRWNGRFKSFTDDVDLVTTKAYASAQAVSSAAASAAGEMVGDAIAFTDGGQMDSVAVNEPFMFRLNRDPAHADDAHAADARLFCVILREV
jgi:hypothetical protein